MHLTTLSYISEIVHSTFLLDQSFLIALAVLCFNLFSFLLHLGSFEFIVFFLILKVVFGVLPLLGQVFIALRLLLIISVQSLMLLEHFAILIVLESSERCCLG